MKIWKGHSQLSKSEVKTLLNTKSIIRWCRADPFRVTPRSPLLYYRFYRLCYPPSQHLHLWGMGRELRAGFPGIGAHFQGRQESPVLPSTREACMPWGSSTFPAHTLPGTAGLEKKSFSSKITLYFFQQALFTLSPVSEIFLPILVSVIHCLCCLQSWPGPNLHSYFQLPLLSPLFSFILVDKSTMI